MKLHMLKMLTYAVSTFFFIFPAFSSHASSCRHLLGARLSTTAIGHIPDYNDPRLKLEKLYRRQSVDTLKIGEGNSALVYLVRQDENQFIVVKDYREHRKDALERDHLGLIRIRQMFDLDKNHSLNIKVVSSEIKLGFGGNPTKKVLVMPFVPGINLHDLLINSPQHPLTASAIALYEKMIEELDRTAHLLGFRDQIEPESKIYFRDHKIDGLMTLKIGARPSLLIKTDNIIFNPEDNSLTLIDPY